MVGNGMVAVVSELPPCSFCAGSPRRKARYDGATTGGPWAFMCVLHFKQYGLGLGLGVGQYLRLEREPLTPEEAR
jgi:hypothetical protein